jgi:glucose-6-phosphate dehydrogenase assembly protein OpcA
VATKLVDEWRGENASIAEIEAELVRLREGVGEPGAAAVMRTSVMTHCAWVPPERLDAAEAVLAGLNERHPSRVIVLVPRPDEPDGLDASVSVRCFPAGDDHVCGELIELSLRGNRTRSPASIVLPLVISDLPVFCRWRGAPLFDDAPWEQLLDVADRVIVDSSEWEELRYGSLVPAFERTAVSDIAWARLREWRAELAGHWPGIRDAEIDVRGPRAEATLLRAWLAARLGRNDLAPVGEAGELAVTLGSEELQLSRPERTSPSDLLSAELDRFGRDRIYEEAAAAAA